MKKLITFAAVAALFLVFGPVRASAQGPAGNGAGNAAVSGSSASTSSSGGSGRSYNPLHWIKKSKSSSDQLDSNSERDKHLEANLKSAGVIPAQANLSDACGAFTALHSCLATLHASRNTGIDFACLRADVTGTTSNADVSACKGSSDKRMDLHKAIRLQKPDADAKSEAKHAEKQASDDLKDAQ